MWYLHTAVTSPAGRWKRTPGASDQLKAALAPRDIEMQPHVQIPSGCRITDYHHQLTSTSSLGQLLSGNASIRNYLTVECSESTHLVVAGRHLHPYTLAVSFCPDCNKQDRSSPPTPSQSRPSFECAADGWIITRPLSPTRRSKNCMRNGQRPLRTNPI